MSRKSVQVEVYEETFKNLQAIAEILGCTPEEALEIALKKFMEKVVK